MEGIPSAGQAVVVGQTTDSTKRIRRLVTTIISSSRSSIYSSLWKALRHHSLILSFLASLFTSSGHLEFVLPTFLFPLIFFSLSWATAPFRILHMNGSVYSWYTHGSCHLRSCIQRTKFKVKPASPDTTVLHWSADSSPYFLLILIHISFFRL